MWDWIKKAHDLNRGNQPYAVVTLIHTNGSTPRNAGAKMIVTAGERFGTIGGGRLEDLAIHDARQRMDSVVTGKSEKEASPTNPQGTESYPLCFRTGQCCGGAVEALVEVQNVGPQLIIFGAGHVAQALCAVLDETPFRSTLVDQRPEWIESTLIPASVLRLALSYSDMLKQYSSNRQNTYFLVMTHDHALDLDIVTALLDLPARYIGVIGSQTKAKRFKKQLERREFNLDLIHRMECPIGKQGKGKSPKEIAINIASRLFEIYDDAR